MVFFYDLLLRLYILAVRIAAVRYPKAKLFLEGRQSTLSTLKTALEKETHVQRLWMHCASLGEFEQGKPVLEALRKRYPEAFILLTFFSPSGYEVRKNDPLADVVTYLPIDTARNAHEFINLLQPTGVIFVKYDIWFHYLSELYRRKIPTFLIAAHYRAAQWRWFSPQRLYLRRALNFFTHIFLQDDASALILKRNGFTKMTVCGDTRVERVLAIKNANTENVILQKFKNSAQLIICGSTWQMDENFIADWFQNSTYNAWKFVIAPHSVAASRIAALQKMFPDAILYSEVLKNDTNHLFSSARLLIIDNIGLLAQLYRYSDIVYIGGGFGKGIHNTLEPAAFGAPIIFGPKYQKFIEAEYFVKHGGAFSFENMNQFQTIISQLLNYETRATAAKIATDYLLANDRATDKIMEIMIKNI